MFHSHEKSVDDDAKRNEQINKGVHNEQFDEVSKFVPSRTALPTEE